TASEQRRIDRANAKLNQRASDLQEANAKYESFFGGPSEAQAAAVVVVTPQPQPEQQAEVQPPVAAPEPMPEPSAEATQPQQQEEIAQATPAPEPVTTPEPTKPKQLPRTAGEMNLIGLIGLASLTGGYLKRFFRR